MSSRPKNIVLAWEWGTGVGHLRPFAPLAQRLNTAGHHVTIVARDVTHVRRFFDRGSFALRQAPCNTANVPDKIQRPTTIAGLAWNLGYDSRDRIAGLVEAWRGLLTELRTDLVICEFGLTASLVAHLLQLPRLALGTGFTCPPATQPLTLLHAEGKDAQAIAMAADVERQVLGNINGALKENGLPTIETFAAALCRPEETLLATVPEFDPYRRNVAPPEYLGIWNRASGVAPTWRNGSSRRAIAYLKPFRNFPHLHRALAAHRVGVALAADGIPRSMLAGPQPPVMLLQDGLIDLQQAAPGCSFGITNGNHATTLRMLSLGLPVLVCPLFIEQRCTARRIAKCGLGVAVDPAQPQGFGPAIEALLSGDSLRRSVEGFAQRYEARFSAAEERVAERLFAAVDRI